MKSSRPHAQPFARCAALLCAVVAATLALGCSNEPAPSAPKAEAKAPAPKPQDGAAAAAKTPAPGGAQPDAVKLPKIVSVGGAVTETLYALGVERSVVGVDTSSLYPEAATKLPKVGYQRRVAAESILGLGPGLVVGTKSMGPEAAVEQLKGAGVDVLLLDDTPTVEAAKARIVALGERVGEADKAAALTAKIDADLAKAAERSKGWAKARPRVLFVYARGAKTLLVSGAKTPADAMIRLAGGANAVEGFEGFKPLTAEAAIQANPDVVLIPKRGLDSLGGLEGLWALPGLAQTPAGKAKAFIAADDLRLLGFGPRLGEAAVELAEALEPLAKAKAGAP